jgi:hypothetical protein
MRMLMSLAAIMLLAAAAAPTRAEELAAQRAKPEPAATLDAKTFSLPPSAFDKNKFNYAPPQPGASGFDPGRVDLGSSVLQFDTKRQQPDTRVGIEALDPKRLGGISKDDSTPLPNYFGMTLSKPLN